MNEARSVLGVICSAYDSFFEAEKKIADYIMEHKDQAVDMTVGELAKASGASSSARAFLASSVNTVLTEARVSAKPVLPRCV